MRTLALCVLALFCAAAGFGQSRQELGLTIGSFGGGDQGVLKLGRGTAFQANYAVRLAGTSKVALLGEVHFLANPQRVVSSPEQRATRDVASLFLTPGVRVKFAPQSRVQPYLAAGAGYALFEQSTLDIGGEPNRAPRTINRGAFVFGGGVDFPVRNWFGLRFEVRDFYSGSPAYGVRTRTSGQHNVVVGGGFYLGF